MDFSFTKEQKDIKKAAADFASGEFKQELAKDYELNHRYPRELFKKAGELGFIGLDYPEEIGGGGLGILENVLVVEPEKTALYDWSGKLNQTVIGHCGDCTCYEWVSPPPGTYIAMFCAYEGYTCTFGDCDPAEGDRTIYEATVSGQEACYSVIFDVFYESDEILMEVSATPQMMADPDIQDLGDQIVAGCQGVLGKEATCPSAVGDKPCNYYPVLTPNAVIDKAAVVACLQAKVSHYDCVNGLGCDAYVSWAAGGSDSCQEERVAEMPETRCCLFLRAGLRPDVHHDLPKAALVLQVPQDHVHLADDQLEHVQFAVQNLEDIVLHRGFG